MIEEVERLKSDLKHTTSARARAESREDEVRNNLTAVEGELLAVQNDLIETRDRLQSAQYELQMVRDELIMTDPLPSDRNLPATP